MGLCQKTATSEPGPVEKASVKIRALVEIFKSYLSLRHQRLNGLNSAPHTRSVNRWKEPEYFFYFKPAADVVDDVTRVEDDPGQPAEGEGGHDGDNVLRGGDEGGQSVLGFLEVWS